MSDPIADLYSWYHRRQAADDHRQAAHPDRGMGTRVREFFSPDETESERAEASRRRKASWERGEREGRTTASRAQAERDATRTTENVHRAASNQAANVRALYNISVPQDHDGVPDSLRRHAQDAPYRSPVHQMNSELHDNEEYQLLDGEELSDPGTARAVRMQYNHHRRVNPTLDRQGPSPELRHAAQDDVRAIARYNDTHGRRPLALTRMGYEGMGDPDLVENDREENQRRLAAHARNVAEDARHDMSARDPVTQADRSHLMTFLNSEAAKAASESVPDSEASGYNWGIARLGHGRTTELNAMDAPEFAPNIDTRLSRVDKRGIENEEDLARRAHEAVREGRYRVRL